MTKTTKTNKKNIIIATILVILTIFLIIFLALNNSKEEDTSSRNNSSNRKEEIKETETKKESVSKSNVTVEYDDIISKYEEYDNSKNTTDVYMVGSYITETIKEENRNSFKDNSKYYRLFKTTNGDIVAIRDEKIDDTDVVFPESNDSYPNPGKVFRLYASYEGEYTYDGKTYKLYNHYSYRTNFASYDKEKIDKKINDYVSKLNSTYKYEKFSFVENYIETSGGINVIITNENDTIKIELTLHAYDIYEIHPDFDYVGTDTNFDEIDRDCIAAIFTSGFNISKKDFNKLYDNDLPESCDTDSDINYKNQKNFTIGRSCLSIKRYNKEPLKTEFLFIYDNNYKKY